MVLTGVKKSQGARGTGGEGGSHTEGKAETQRPFGSSRQRNPSSSTDDHRLHKSTKSSKKASEVTHTHTHTIVWCSFLL